MVPFPEGDGIVPGCPFITLPGQVVEMLEGVRTLSKAPFLFFVRTCRTCSQFFLVDNLSLIADI